MSQNMFSRHHVICITLVCRLYNTNVNYNSPSNVFIMLSYISLNEI